MAGQLVLGRRTTAVYEVEVLLDGASEEPLDMLAKELIAHVLLLAIRLNIDLQGTQ